MKHVEQEPAGFVDLWKLWLPHSRHTDGRGKARPHYRKWILNGAAPEDIIDGARWHLRMLKDPAFIELLSSYLNSEKWADDCEQERKFQRAQQEREERRSKPVPNNVQFEPHRPVRPPEAERARHAADLLARLGLKQAAE